MLLLLWRVIPRHDRAFCGQATPEGQERNRKWAREGKRRQLADPVERAKHQARWAMFNAKAHHCAPPWLTAEHERTIETIFAIAGFLARKTGIPHDVDHYYPIINDTCCGLHVPWNLRVIPAHKNQSKGNRLPA
jgi:hypothetical protein